MHVVQVCTGRTQKVSINGRTVLSAIHKTAVEGPVRVGPLGLEGDEQADLNVHGGLSKAVYAYASEHLAVWQTMRAQAQVALWDEPIAPGLMGENLLLSGVLESMLWIGDRLVLPHCTLVVSEPRMPCFKFAAAIGLKQGPKLMAQSGYCGAYLVVLQPGTVQAGDPIRLEPGPREVGLSELFKQRARGLLR
jgi:MOSC domain-containing protein YiiM